MAKTNLSERSWGDVRIALKQARLDRGWTQVDLAEATDYTKGRISQEEKESDKSIPFRYLDRVIPALGFDSIQGLFDTVHRKFVIPLAQRSTVAAPKRGAKQQVLESMVYEALAPVRQHRSLMKKLSSKDPILPLMRMANPQTREVATLQGQEAARRFRDFLGVSSDGPLMDLGRILGRLGIAIKGCALPEGIQGVIVGNTDQGYAILYSNSDQAKRQLFTVAHELGHLVMDTLPYVEKKPKKPSPPRERRANAFAATLLLPERWVDRVAAGLGVSKRTRSQRPWRALLRQLSVGSGASETSCAYKLRDLRYISEEELQEAIAKDTRFGRLGQLEDNLDHLLLGKTMAAVEAHLITPRKGLEILNPVWQESTPKETGYEQADIEQMLRNLVSLA